MKRTIGAPAMIGILVLGGLALGGCAIYTVDRPAPAMTGDWVLVSGADDSGEFDLSATTITLTVSEGENSGGRTPCNNYGAIVAGGGNDVTVEVTLQTEAACVDEYLMELEGRYLIALGLVDDAEVGSDSLDLSGPGVELGYERARP